MQVGRSQPGARQRALFEIGLCFFTVTFCFHGTCDTKRSKNPRPLTLNPKKTQNPKPKFNKPETQKGPKL